MTDRITDYQVAICSRTGFKIKASNLGEEWTGLRVRDRSVDIKHPSYDMPAPRGEEVRENATGPDIDIEYGDTNPPPTLAQLGENN